MFIESTVLKKSAWGCRFSFVRSFVVRLLENLHSNRRTFSSQAAASLWKQRAEMWNKVVMGGIGQQVGKSTEIGDNSRQHDMRGTSGKKNKQRPTSRSPGERMCGCTRRLVRRQWVCDDPHIGPDADTRVRARSLSLCLYRAIPACFQPSSARTRKK